tara:strand:+ start:1439 stop:1684 length:246 start_codon:yes stop_codon:yes gene_type:complete
MKIKLSYFLGKRGVDLAGFCENNQIKNYEQLSAYLLENRVSCPDESEVEHIFKTPVLSSTSSSRPLKKKATKSQKKKSLSS